MLDMEETHMAASRKDAAWVPRGRDRSCKVCNGRMQTVWGNAMVAKGFGTRGRGLLGMRALDHQTALVFPRCSNVHCAFMRIPIDIVYLGHVGEVLDIQTVAPWRVARRVKGTKTVIEAAAGSCAAHGVGVGDVLAIVEGGGER